MQPRSLTEAFDIDLATADVAPLPDRVLLYAPPKWGKSAFAAFAEAPVFLCTKGEDGIHVLKKTGQVPAAVKVFPRLANTWGELLAAVASAARKPPRTLVLDTLNGAEELCHAHVCKEVYGGDWGEKGFSAYQVGYRTTGPQEFRRLLDGLDLVRQAGSTVVCLAHTAIKKRLNPHGADYDATAPAVHEETWKVASRRFDLILWGTYEQSVTKAGPKDRKGKATGGTRRVIVSQPGAAHEAGGRYPLPEEIDCGTSAAEAWANFQAALNPPAEPAAA